MSEKQKFPAADAQLVADEIVAALSPACERIIVAGSMRRRKEQVGDVEILYIPKFGRVCPPGEIFVRECNLADLAIGSLEEEEILFRRLNVKNSEVFGEKNKLMRAVFALKGAWISIPVDLFATTADAWFNYLVCRTGGTESNTRIASRAKERGYKWNPYGVGFTRLSDGELIPMESETAVFRFVGLPYEEPWQRP